MPLDQTTQSQTTNPTTQTSALSEASKGAPDTQVPNATTSTTHNADPITRNPPKTDGNTPDPQVVNPSGSTAEEEYDLELPEGSELTEEDLNEIAEEAGRLNLSKADAEKLLSQRESAYKKGLTKAQEGYKAEITKAAEEIKKHPDFVGDAKVKSFESINRVLTAFGDENLNEALKHPIIGNNIHLALFLKRLGDAMASDTVDGKGTTAAPAQSTEVKKEEALKELYPSFFQNN